MTVELIAILPAIGSCACPGMVGATVGGCVGRFQGVNGLIIDSLLSVRLVAADGKQFTVSETSHPDLFWALRGAAPNFGIITSATYKLHPQNNNGQIFNADFIFPAAANASYFDIIESLQGTIPAELSTISILGYNVTVGEVRRLSMPLCQNKTLADRSNRLRFLPIGSTWALRVREGSSLRLC